MHHSKNECIFDSSINYSQSKNKRQMNFQTAPIEPSTKKSQSDFPNDFFMYKAVDGSSVHEFRNENLKNLSETVEQLFNPKKLDESMFDCTATDDELAEYK